MGGYRDMVISVEVRVWWNWILYFMMVVRQLAVARVRATSRDGLNVDYEVFGIDYCYRLDC